jgi:hypothetical protein
LITASKTQHALVVVETGHAATSEFLQIYPTA